MDFSENIEISLEEEELDDKSDPEHITVVDIEEQVRSCKQCSIRKITTSHFQR